MELSPEVTRFARSRPVIECAQCGERIYDSGVVGMCPRTVAACGYLVAMRRLWHVLLKPRCASQP